MFWKKDLLFCDINPTCYAISQYKEISKRHVKDFLSRQRFASTMQREELPVTVSSHQSNMIKRSPGVDISTQENKLANIVIACGLLDGLIIYPGEVFSFWRIVGKTTLKRGFLDGRVLQRNGLTTGIGGGLCNLANTIHLLVLHSPLEVTEFHNHSDALAPDEHGRVPLSAGTSVAYNYIDFRFANITDQDIQLICRCEGEILVAQLRSETQFPWNYEIVEEDHHFAKEGERYYRISKIYKATYETASGRLIDKQLILDNHSRVFFDYALIPQDQIW